MPLNGLRRLWTLFLVLLSMLSGFVGYLIGCIGAFCVFVGIAGLYFGRGTEVVWPLLAGAVLLGVACIFEFHFDRTWSLLRRLFAKSKTPGGPIGCGRK